MKERDSRGAKAFEASAVSEEAQARATQRQAQEIELGFEVFATFNHPA
jgi:hypothetical protein